MNRREFIQLLGLAASSAGYSTNLLAKPSSLYDLPKLGSTRLLHFTDCHAQLMPIYFREPNVNIGIGDSFAHPPHLVGEALLNYFNLSGNSRLSHAFTYLDYDSAVDTYGKVGGFAHLASLVKKLRAQAGDNQSLLLDGGDTWQGSWTSYKTKGMDMVNACNLLGVDVMTGHWEFTYQDTQTLNNIKAFNGDFIAQNVFATEEALFDDTPVYDEESGHVFPPYVIKELAHSRIAIIGQAFPYTPVANPKRFIPNWTFGINQEELQILVNNIREIHKPDVVVLLSHNGADVDIKMANMVTGIDVILGGHTHDGIPQAIPIRNNNGVTLVTNAGSNGKFLGVMDLDIKDGRIYDYQYKLLPVFSNLIQADKEMSNFIKEVRAPHLDYLQQELGTAETTLYRRGNFNGTFDQLICNALTEENDAQISLSPGFRWGTTIPVDNRITMERVLDQTCMTYPETYRRQISGKNLKLILEDVCDNLFNPNPYYQQGGDMVRVGGMNYTCNPNETIGHRISEMTLDNGTKIDDNKNYVVSGWATVNEVAPGPPVWEQVANYLNNHKTVRVEKLNSPKLVGIENNPGYAKV
ncbi:MAG: thiosulfohydrolase SoxB [Pseudomonadota bacterium]